MSSNTLDEARGGYPDSLAGKLGWVAMSAALISLFFCVLVSMREFLFVVVLVSAVVWTLIAAMLQARPRWIYVLVGALSPMLVLPVVVGVMETLKATPESPSVFLVHVLMHFPDGFRLGLHFAPWFTILGFPLGMATGFFAHLAMREEV